MSSLSDTVDQLKESLGDDWLPAVYRSAVRSQRTRSYHLSIAARVKEPIIQYTLLGIELKAGRRRFSCPDLATARYLRVFARIGCRDFAIPYDITRISAAADLLETAWQRALLMTAQMSDDPRRDAVENRVTKLMRAEIAEIGPGESMPAFDRPTRQRRS